MVRPAPGAARTVTILNFLSERPSSAFTLTEIARATGLVMASTQTALSELASAGYVVRHAAHKTYSVGPLLTVFGHAARTRYPAIGLATREMERLSREFGREALLAVATDDEAVTIARAGRRHARSLEVGQRVPLVAPLAASFVAWASEQQIERWRGEPASVHPDLQSFYEQILVTTRLRGYSVVVETKPRVQTITDAVAWAAAHPEPTTRQELQRALSSLVPVDGPGPDLMSDHTLAVRSIGAPVFDAEGRAMLSISMSDLPDLMGATELARWGSRIRDAATTVTKQTQGALPVGWPQ